MHKTRVLGELDELVTEIEGQLLAFASSSARTEWGLFRETCSSAASARPRAFATTDDDLAILLSKARRFREVLLLA